MSRVYGENWEIGEPTFMMKRDKPAATEYQNSTSCPSDSIEMEVYHKPRWPSDNVFPVLKPDSIEDPSCIGPVAH
ncbi:hypothetical protein AVEN_48959-1 [Araneus ventricosus]|uniref:Uncharacterized protein n=1 Tax=Araneus ventricosus TaxID=182803 RepID=A0A4Y2AGZ0_ARAVE|nr:hypothetical protein AVEN_48959-1 [Araneus ventricosus]